MSEVQAAEMDFLQRVAVLRDRVKSFAIWEEFGVEPLYVHIKSSQLKWFKHVMRISLRGLPAEVFWASAQGRSMIDWRDYISCLAWECFGVPPEDLKEVTNERLVWASLLRS